MELKWHLILWRIFLCYVVITCGSISHDYWEKKEKQKLLVVHEFSQLSGNISFCLPIVFPIVNCDSGTIISKIECRHPVPTQKPIQNVTNCPEVYIIRIEVSREKRLRFFVMYIQVASINKVNVPVLAQLRASAETNILLINRKW